MPVNDQSIVLKTVCDMKKTHTERFINEKIVDRKQKKQ